MNTDVADQLAGARRGLGTPDSEQAVALSIVVPVYNERESIRPLCEAIVRAVAPLGYTFEVLLVDDGSTDGTFEQALQLARQDRRLRLIKLSKNFGQTLALYAGFEQARGDVIVTMDGDLQNDPEDIGRLVEKVYEGYDLVAGWREQRKDRLISRKIPSRIANWLIRKVMGTPIRDNGCALRAYRAEVIKKFRLYSEMHRLLPTMLALSGAAIAQLKVRHHPRKYGHSKYGLSRVYKVLFDIIALKTIMTAFRLPFFGFGITSLLCLAFSVAALGFSGVHVMMHPESTAYVYLGVGMLWGLLGVALLLFGVLCGLVYTRANFRAEHLLKVDIL
ncbi:glycosyltransferase family 2 protein [Rhodocaloribacter litoris]|uniref:glycosyltransferase family 2 protein n=1 Tax=Rhodocaloribacter litoris TaxID=2558931 RepID=UPI0014220D29|nr:glycosyltransferase family 2 protein [Rhodocaloribacter litoris]QXD16212.1 glycosyltransferase family 2 protein [Rhodocaloribacter litoris]